MSEHIEVYQVENPQPVKVEFTSFPVQKRTPDAAPFIEAGIPEEHALTAASLAMEGLVQADLVNRQTKVDAFKTHRQDEHDKNMAEHIAETDSLTGLRNRSGLMNEINRRIEAGGDESHFALVFVDLDGFKAVNDTLGHEAGDDVLSGVGSFFKEASLPKKDDNDDSFKFRNNTDEAFRLGGDEFVILISTKNSENGERSLTKNELSSVEGFEERLSSGIRRSGKDVDDSIEVDGSFGYAVHNKGESAEKFIGRADQEMYLRKGAKKVAAELMTIEPEELEEMPKDKRIPYKQVEFAGQTWDIPELKYGLENVWQNIGMTLIDYDNYKVKGYKETGAAEVIESFSYAYPKLAGRLAKLTQQKLELDNLVRAGKVDPSATMAWHTSHKDEITVLSNYANWAIGPMLWDKSINSKMILS